MFDVLFVCLSVTVLTVSPFSRSLFVIGAEVQPNMDLSAETS